MTPHTLFVHSLRTRHGGNLHAAIAASAYTRVVWMLLDRHHITADTIPADVVATIARECALAEADVRAYLRLPPCDVDGQPQPMEPLDWAGVAMMRWG